MGNNQGKTELSIKIKLWVEKCIKKGVVKRAQASSILLSFKKQKQKLSSILGVIT